MSEETEVGGGDATVAPLRRRPGPGGPRKRANATTNVSADDFNDDDEVTNLKAVKLRLACEMWAGGDPVRLDDGEPRPGGHDRARLLWALVGEAEALDATVPRDAGRG